MTPLVALREKMKHLSLDAILVMDEKNQQYLSGFAFTDGYLLILSETAYLVTDFRYKEAAERLAYTGFTVEVPDGRFSFLQGALEEAGARRLGFEGSVLTFAEHKRYKERLKGIRLYDIGDAIDTMREVKSGKEIASIEKAQSITDAAFSELLKVLSPRMTEIEVAAELEYRMRRLGAEGMAFETIAVSGTASALPHGTPRTCPLECGFLTMDFGAKFEGYCSDMTRTIAIGKASAEMKHLYETVLSAQRAALDFLRAGVACSEADSVARRIIERDYPGTFGHSLGHGVGLYIHENPRLSAKNLKSTLVCGNVVTVEPGIYIEGKYGCRIEDMVVIEECGIKNLTKSPKNLIEIL